MKGSVGWVLCLMLVGCSGAKTTILPTPDYVGPPIQRIAIASGGGVLGDAIAVELAARGFDVVEAADSADAMLKITASGDYQGLPQSAALRLTTVPDGQLIAAGTWENGWGGGAGSIADRMMRQDAPDAARRIVNEICKRIAPERAKEIRTIRDRK